MSGKAGGSVIGYKYYVGMHMIICREVDALVGISVGGRILWGANASGDGFNPTGATTSQDISVNKPNLFGGTVREGGITGTIGFKKGEATQGPDPYLVDQFGADFTPAFRGVVSIILKGIYFGINPYLKPWSFTVTRASCPDWLPTKAKILASDGYYDSNGAHIIREAIINTDWGMGEPVHRIDDATFQAAANALFSENFGISIVWDQQTSVENFIQSILNHINGVLYVSQTTGNFELKLLRADYNLATLPILDERNIIQIESFQRASWGETSNEIILQYSNRITAKSATVTVQDIANMQVQGTIVSRTSKYKGICDPNLALRLAQRDLQTYSTPISKLRLTVNRTAWNFHVGDVFKLSWAKLGIVSVVFRVGQISRGSLLDGSITIDAVEDVFALPAATFVAPELTQAPQIQRNPIPSPNQRLVEACFWDVARRLGAPDALAQDVNSAWAVGVVARPGPMSSNYQFRTSSTSATGPWDKEVTGYYSPSCLCPALAQEDVSTFTYSNATDLRLVSAGDYGYIGNEMVSVVSIDMDTYSITLNRGVLDTVPVAHASSRLYLMSSLHASHTWEYALGETIYGFSLPTFPNGTLPQDEATVMSVPVVARPGRPYPPGNLRFKGQRFPSLVNMDEDLVITWAHRNRAQQTAYIILQTEGNIGPEPGVTYDVTVTHSSLGVLSSQTGLTGTSFTYLATEYSDKILASPNPTPAYYAYTTSITVEVWAVRDGIESYQKAHATFAVYST